MTNDEWQRNVTKGPRARHPVIIFFNIFFSTIELDPKKQKAKFLMKIE
jgi:hypothetical protein